MKDLEKRIEQLDNELSESQQDAWDNAELWDDYWDRFYLRSRLIRELCEEKGLEYAEPIDDEQSIPWQYEAPYVSVAIARDFGTITVEFSIDSHWRTEKGIDAKRACLEFNRAYFFKYGLPNEDAWPQHRLWDRGLSGFNVVRVRNSTLIPEVDVPSDVDSVDHVLMLFKDYCIECCAETFSWNLINT